MLRLLTLPDAYKYLQACGLVWSFGLKRPHRKQSEEFFHQDSKYLVYYCSHVVPYPFTSRDSWFETSRSFFSGLYLDCVLRPMLNNRNFNVWGIKSRSRTSIHINSPMLPMLNIVFFCFMQWPWIGIMKQQTSKAKPSRNQGRQDLISATSGWGSKIPGTLKTPSW